MQKLFHLALLILFSVILVSSVNEEGVSLLEFKRSLSDPNNKLESWNSSDLTPCNWIGIGCTDFKVTSVNLIGFDLSGTLAPSICNLTHLTELNVSKNSISGPIPKDLAICHNLEILDLCTNRFHGEFPTPISKMIALRKLYLCENYIYGEVPEEVGNLTSLEELVIYSNNLTG